MAGDRKELYLCGGLQSSGSTLVSWCFLQRPDMNGVLDARFDTVPALPAVSEPRLWCKFTVACFTFDEMYGHFRDEGWDVRPLLVVRDVRAVFNSLLYKHYGRNGTTADDPPIRTRLRRFQRDVTLFQDRGWPVLRYEDMTGDGAALRSACEKLGLPWEPAMVEWPKPANQVADADFGNETFLQTRGATLASTIDPARLAARVDKIPPDDLDWLEAEFETFNRQYNYPPHVNRETPWPHAWTRAVPAFEATRRSARSKRKDKLLARCARRFRLGVYDMIGYEAGSKRARETMDIAGDR